MNKDVIYIDVEDDITAIIGKVKDAKEKIVALVPPKRVGVLQSAVNLRLLSRAAGQADKRLVVITNNAALTALAAAAKIPIAKNLQSKPEVPEIAALDIDNGEDVIDGASLPIGDHARTAGNVLGGAAVSEAIRENAAETAPHAAPPMPGNAPAKPRVKSGIRVPNFNSFRKKLIFGIGGGVLVIAFLVWAIFIAPHATVIITARTTDSSANAKVALDPAVTTSFASNSLKTAVQQQKKDTSLEFEATGSKEVGEKAKGQMTLNRTSVSSNPITVPAGTSFSYGNYTFVSTEAATLNGTSVGPGGIVQDSATVGVVATAVGDEYNLSGRTYQSNVSGMSAQGSDMSGGSKRQIKVVSNDDVQKATDQIAQNNSDDIKKQLVKQFDDTFIVLDQSFKVDRGSPQVTPGVDQEVTAGVKPKVTIAVTYSLSGVTKADVNKYLEDYFKKQLEGTNDQRVYDNGSSKATFNDLNANGAGFSANLVATAKIGPKIDDNAIKDSAKGKRYGDIQSSIESIQGVDNVDVKFFPFWVNSAPGDTNRISIEFNLNGAK